jgi:hypothetical protein
LTAIRNSTVKQTKPQTKTPKPETCIEETVRRARENYRLAGTIANFRRILAAGRLAEMRIAAGLDR